MIWLDNLFAIPAIGIRMNPNFNEVFEFQKRLGGFLDFLVKEEKYPMEQIEIKARDIWGFSVSVQKTGFSFVLTPKDIISQFLYEFKKTERPGELPKFEAPEIMPYGQLLEKVYKYLERIVNLIKDLKGFQFDRIGIVANLSSNKESLPPGILRWLKYLEKPLSEVNKTDVTFTANIGNKSDDFYDRCHHNMRYDNETPEIGFRITLDWQRMFKKPLFLSDSKGLMANINSSKENALAYFQRFGEGDLNYE